MRQLERRSRQDRQPSSGECVGCARSVYLFPCLYDYVYVCVCLVCLQVIVGGRPRRLTEEIRAEGEEAVTPGALLDVGNDVVFGEFESGFNRKDVNQSENDGQGRSHEAGPFGGGSDYFHQAL